MNLAQQFALLGKKQLDVQAGIDLLTQIQAELARTRTAGDAWGTAAVLANATLVPLNVIVNAFDMKAAGTAYEFFAKHLYKHFGQSGTRLDGHAKKGLELVKGAIVDELKRRSLAEYVPGVNILVGLAEDSLAAWQAMQTVTAGKQEMKKLTDGLENKIAAATAQMFKLGVKRAEMLERAKLLARTA